MRVLWTKRDEPDNHVYPWFLGQLRCNKPVVGYHYKILLNDASVVLLNLCLTMIFLLTFVCIYNNHTPAYIFPLASSILYTPIALYSKKYSGSTVFEDIKSVCVTTFALLTLTPVFRSLTESTSSDSIWAICGWLLFANFIFSCVATRVLATNTALAATIVLSSRLSSSTDVFYFVAFNIQTFIGLPIWFFNSKHSKPDRSRSNTNVNTYRPFSVSNVEIALVLLLVAGASLGLACYVFHWALALTYFVIMNLAFWGIPALFIKLQKYKNQISGPWDPAVPVLS